MVFSGDSARLNQERKSEPDARVVPVDALIDQVFAAMVSGPGHDNIPEQFVFRQPPAVPRLLRPGPWRAILRPDEVEKQNVASA
jgi:hypothetical protein